MASLLSASIQLMTSVFYPDCCWWSWAATSFIANRTLSLCLPLTSFWKHLISTSFLLHLSVEIKCHLHDLLLRAGHVTQWQSICLMGKVPGLVLTSGKSRFFSGLRRTLMNYAFISEVFMETIVNTDPKRKATASLHYTTVFTKSIYVLRYTCLSSFEVVLFVYCNLWNK